MAFFGLLPDKPKPLDSAKTASTAINYSTQAAQAGQALNAQGANRYNPFGSSTTQVDANGVPTGQTASLSAPLQGAANSGMNAAQSQFGLLPTNGINWDNTTAPQIAQQNYDAYAAMTAPQRQQQQSALNVNLSDRGLPVGSEIYNDQWQNLNNSFNLADTNAAAQAWNAVPGMQSQLQSNQIQQYDQPGNSAGQTLGLLNQVGGLTPGFASLPQANVNDPNYAGLEQNRYNAQMDQYNATMGGLGNLAGAGLGLLAAPMTGGTSLLGMGLGGLFNSSGSAAAGSLNTANGPSGAASSWQPTTWGTR